MTQLNDIELPSARSYLRELADKYPVGAKIPSTPANTRSGLAGDVLDGDLVLQVPPQRGGVIPDEVADYARVRGIRILDINGFDYTA